MKAYWGKDHEGDTKMDVLHITEEADASQVDSKVVNTDLPNAAGYPVDEHGNQICVYRDGECYVDGNRHNGRQVPLSGYLQIQVLVNELG